MNGVHISIVNVWQHISSADGVARWRVTETPALVALEDIMAAVIWSYYDDATVCTILPSHLR